MTMIEDHADYLKAFGDAAAAHIASLVGQHGELTSCAFAEDAQSIWVRAALSLSGITAERRGTLVYTRRNLIVRRAGGPVDDVLSGAGLFASAVIEDLDNSWRA
ncbi:MULTISPECIES: hypothetical protein [unclassified Streptomyces]|uniref:hypothetical protein n=1 Tax=unclassified Streptomyces TaxID=2593676 RepID=UPI000DBA5702|nr:MULTISPECIES: hypothetical protein [unclassified Streptomyces]MYT68287.1 hypothetical protein [Streptomyces sp. SID8367]RAJ76922.1 hypothetical protein K377_06090 [Streptomyces sp. PsTaAH-137]